MRSAISNQIPGTFHEYTFTHTNSIVTIITNNLLICFCLKIITEYTRRLHTRGHDCHGNLTIEISFPAHSFFQQL